MEWDSETELSPFEVLGISPDAEPEVITAAYKAMARKHHPDANPTASQQSQTSRMAELNWARDELTENLAWWREQVRGGRPGRHPSRAPHADTESEITMDAINGVSPHLPPEKFANSCVWIFLVVGSIPLLTSGWLGVMFTDGLPKGIALAIAHGIGVISALTYIAWRGGDRRRWSQALGDEWGGYEFWPCTYLSGLRESGLQTGTFVYLQVAESGLRVFSPSNNVIAIPLPLVDQAESNTNDTVLAIALRSRPELKLGFESPALLHQSLGCIEDMF